MLAALRRLDRRAYERVTRAPSPRTGRMLAAVSRLADRSRLWITLAGVLATTGASGRRAALRGLVSIGITSALINAFLKPGWGRQRPYGERASQLRVRHPRTASFPSGHTGSAFAFAWAVGREIPVLLPVLGLLAGVVGYSRIHSRVHYPGDVLAGAAIGVAVGEATGGLTRRLFPAHRRAVPAPAAADGVPRRPLILVTNHHAGRASRLLRRARREIERRGLQIAAELPITRLEILDRLLAPSSPRTIVVAAGGDGTAGAVADRLAYTGTPMAVLPLGTSNDFARSLGISMRVENAVALLVEGKLSKVDLGRLEVPGERHRHFVHAATAGLNVDFARLATRTSLRQRLGRFTYAVAAALALRERTTFDCTLSHDSGRVSARLAQLSVINAPVFGGFLGLRVEGSRPDDHQLDVLAIEDLSPPRLALVALRQLFRVRRGVRVVHAFHARRLSVDTDRPLDVTLDGELAGKLPAEFAVAGEALRIITPIDYRDGGGDRG